MNEIKINRHNLNLFINNIRDEDLEELIYFLGNDYKNKFIDFVLNNQKGTYFLEHNSMPSCIGGIYNDNFGGQVWLLCSKDYDKKFLFTYIKEKINVFKKNNSYLYNYIYKSNFKALKWLKKFGFKVINSNNKNIKLFYHRREKSNL